MKAKYPEGLIDLIIIEISMITQLTGGVWLYCQIFGEGLNLSIFGYIAGLWTLVAILILLRDVVACYLLVNREDMPSKLWLMERMSKQQKNLFVLSYFAFMPLCIPAGLYRAKKGL